MQLWGITSESSHISRCGHFWEDKKTGDYFADDIGTVYGMSTRGWILSGEFLFFTNSV